MKFARKAVIATAIAAAVAGGVAAAQFGTRQVTSAGLQASATCPYKPTTKVEMKAPESITVPASCRDLMIGLLAGSRAESADIFFRYTIPGGAPAKVTCSTARGIAMFEIDGAPVARLAPDGRHSLVNDAKYLFGAHFGPGGATVVGCQLQRYVT